MNWVDWMVFISGIINLGCIHIWTVGDVISLIGAFAALMFFWIKCFRLERRCNFKMKNKIYKDKR